MTHVYENIARSFLAQYGTVNVSDVLDGFDLAKPTYVQALNVGDKLLQFVRNPGLHVNQRVGNWFALPSASMRGLAIFGGLSGRSPKTFVVTYPLRVLEGTAKELARNWKCEIGGRRSGGDTQLYVPFSLLGHLRPFE